MVLLSLREKRRHQLRLPKGGVQTWKKKVSSDIRSVKRRQGESHLYSLAFAFLGIGTSVIFFSGNMLNEALNVHVEGINGVFGGVVGILVGIFMVTLIPTTAFLAEKKKKGKMGAVNVPSSQQSK